MKVPRRRRRHRPAATVAVNLTGVWQSLRHEIPVMLARGGGAIVNPSSAAGLWGSPEEVAEAVLWLCPSAASYVTGHALSVDGAHVAQ